MPPLSQSTLAQIEATSSPPMCVLYTAPDLEITSPTRRLHDPGFFGGLVLRRRRWRGHGSFPTVELLLFAELVLNPSDDEDSWRETMAVVVAPC
jgi:hypothetical protein